MDLPEMILQALADGEKTVPGISEIIGRDALETAAAVGELENQKKVKQVKRKKSWKKLFDTKIELTVWKITERGRQEIPP